MSSNQPPDICSLVDYDFAIVKMSGNPQKDWRGKSLRWDYTNPYAKQQADDASRKCGLVGFYHFTWGKEPETEAAFFVQKVRELGYLGKAMLVVDYEGEALELGRSWLSTLCREVKRLAGYGPVIYTSGGVIRNQQIMSLGYPVWCANYCRDDETVRGYDTSGMTIYRGCEESVMWQFAQHSRLPGYDDDLDLDMFFGNEDGFKALMGGKES